MHCEIIGQYAADAAYLAARSGVSVGGSNRPASFKAIGISLAVASGVFIGISFVLKKYGLLKANEKYNEVAGEGYGYLKNFYWWGGMVLMIVGEICNFVAYAFTDAILVTPLGALSVVITTILSAIFLKERLSLVGKVACFLCIVGSVVIVMNAPESSAVSTIQEMQHYVIAPGFLSYAGVIIVGAVITAVFAGPRWGKKNMLVYISICSWVGGLSVVAIQGLGAAIVAQAQGTPQFNQWFLYVLLVFVISTLVTEIIYLNKALNLFNAALVTPTYYVYFTTTTIISSAVLFRGMHGTATSIVTMVNGFLTICSGVVLLQLSKSSKDVPDAAVFSGDLDQIHTIAEQEQPETEPKADAIRGTAAIVRSFSMTRQRREAAEFERLRAEKLAERMGPHGENDPEYEWDGLRRRRTLMSRSSVSSRGTSVGPSTYNIPTGSAASAAPSGPYIVPMRSNTHSSYQTLHPPLGMSRFLTEEELREEEELARRRAASPGFLGSIAGSIRINKRGKVPPTVLEIPGQNNPVALTEMTRQSNGRKGYYSQTPGFNLEEQATEYRGTSGNYSFTGFSDVAPTPPPHSARRQFSFQNLFRRSHNVPASPTSPHVPDDRSPVTKRDSGHSGRMTLGLRKINSQASEEERLGLVKPSGGIDETFADNNDDEDFYEEKVGGRVSTGRFGCGLAESPERSGNSSSEGSPGGRGIGGPYDVERLVTRPREEALPVPRHWSGVEGQVGNRPGILLVGRPATAHVSEVDLERERQREMERGGRRGGRSHSKSESHGVGRNRNKGV